MAVHSEMAAGADASAELLLQQGVAHHQAGRLQQAEQAYRQLLHRCPDDPRALHLLGVIALQTGHFEPAETLLRRALDLAPDQAEVCSNLGLVLAATSRFADARAAFTRAVELNPGYAEAHHNLALALEWTYETDAAMEHYRRAIELKPDYADALCNLAIALHAAKRQPEAIPFYRRALVERPDLTRLSVYLGAAFGEIGEHDNAQAAFDAALLRDPHDPLVPFCRAHAAYERGDPDAALDELRIALERLAASDIAGWSPDPVGASTPSYPVGYYPDALRATVQRLAAAGIDAFLVGGTLIGLCREGSFFSHDKDVDLGVMAEVTPEMLDRAMSGDADFVRTTPLTDDCVLPSYWFRDKVAVDVFRFFREHDHVWCGVPVNDRMLKWRHRPFRLANRDYLDVTVKVPEDPEHFLSECYGDWRTPNPYFAMWASPNIEGGFPPIARCLAYGQIFRSAFSGHRGKALNLCAQALALDPENRLVLGVRDRLLAAPAGEPASATPLPHTLGHAFDDLPG